MAKKYEMLAKPSCGWIPVKMLDGSGYSFVSKLGDLMPFRFSEIEEFVDGFALVGLLEEKNGRKYTYISQDEILCPITFTDISTFKGDYGRAWIGKEEYIIDRKFNVYQFKNTLLDKIKFAEDENNPDVLIQNAEGQVKKFDLIFKLCGPMTEDMAPIIMKDGSGFSFIDRNHNIMPQRFSAPSKFKNGRANVVLTDGSLGYVDKEGNFTLLGDKAPQQLKKQKEMLAKTNDLITQVEEALGIKDEDFETPFFKKMLFSDKFTDEILGEYLRLENEQQKKEFIQKYKASARDIEILDHAIAVAFEDEDDELEEDDDENDIL